MKMRAASNGCRSMRSGSVGSRKHWIRKCWTWVKDLGVAMAKEDKVSQVEEEVEGLGVSDLI